MSAHTGRTRLGFLLPVLLLIAGALTPLPLSAQGSRFRVVVRPLDAANSKQGEKVADALRKQLDAMDTHAAVPEKEVKAAFKKHDLKPEDATCLQYRQVMSQLNAQLVACGTIDASGQVAAQFFNVDGTSFDVPPFAFSTEHQAAEQIRQGFGDYVRLLQVVTYCDSYLRSSQWVEALDNCDQAIALNPKNAHALYGRGSALSNLERLPEALEAFQRVLELDPLNQDALLAGAIAASKLDQQELATKYLNDYLAVDPGNTSVRLNIATQLAKDGVPAAALKLLEQVPAADTVNVTVRSYAGHFAMSAAARAAGANPPKTAEAESYFAKAVHHYAFTVGVLGDTTPQMVLRNLMVAHSNLNHPDEAMVWARRAIAHPEADAQTWSAYADNLRGAGRLQEALAALDRVQQLDPAYSVQARRAFILTDMGRLGDAVSAIRAASAAKELSPQQQDALSAKITKTGFDNFQRAKKYEQAFGYYDSARSVCATENCRAMINFYHGFGLYEHARALQEKGTVASARESLPMFERAKSLLESCGSFTSGSPSLAKNRADALGAINELIIIQQAIIKRG